jgi:hypothetical protein
MHESLMVDDSDLLFGFLDNLLLLEAGLELTHILDYGAVHAHIWDSSAGIVRGTALLSGWRASLRGTQISTLRFVQQSLVGLRDRHQRGVVLAYLQVSESWKLTLCTVLPGTVGAMTTGVNRSHIVSEALPLLVIGWVGSVLHGRLPLYNLVLCILGEIDTAHSAPCMLRKTT